MVTRTDRFTSFQQFGLGRDYREPSWAGDQFLLEFNYGLADTVAIDRIGQGDRDLAGWFSDPQGAQLGGAQAAPRADLKAPGVDCASIRDRLIARGSEPFWGPTPVRRGDGLHRRR